MGVFEQLHQTYLSRFIDQRIPILRKFLRLLWLSRQIHRANVLLKVFRKSNSIYKERNSSSIVTLPKENYFYIDGENFKKELKDFQTSKFHNMGYEHIYCQLFSNLRNADKVRMVLEIGIGSTNPKIRSHMNPDHRPGESLKGWQSLFPNAEVIGADIDRTLIGIFSDFQTEYVDQNNLPSLEVLKNIIEGEIDLVIDDGLHTLRANINSVLTFLPKLSQNGVFVVEDILPMYEKFWETVDFGSNFKSKLYSSEFFSIFQEKSQSCGLVIICRK